MKKILLFLFLVCFICVLCIPDTTSQAINGADVDIHVRTLAEVESFDCSLVTDVPESECEALVDFYLSTNGAGWNNQQICTKGNCWLDSLEVDDWYGVTVTLNHVTSIVLDSNLLEGTLPNTISQLPELIELCLVNNKLSGNIPETIQELKYLQKISFGYNKLEGEIPASLSQLPSLIKLSLDNNLFTGEIPAELGDLPALQRLEVYSNPNLRGSLPESLSELTTLTDLIVFNTLLSGPIPQTYTNLTNLTLFYFFKTNICEPYNPEFLAWKATVTEYHGTELICMDFHCFMPIISR